MYSQGETYSVSILFTSSTLYVRLSNLRHIRAEKETWGMSWKLFLGICAVFSTLSDARLGRSKWDISGQKQTQSAPFLILSVVQYVLLAVKYLSDTFCSFVCLGSLF